MKMILKVKEYFIFLTIICGVQSPLGMGLLFNIPAKTLPVLREDAVNVLQDWHTSVQTLQNSLDNWQDVIKYIVRPSVNDIELYILREMNVNDYLITNIESKINISEEKLKEMQLFANDDFETVLYNIEFLTDYVANTRPENLPDISQLLKYTDQFVTELIITVKSYNLIVEKYSRSIINSVLIALNKQHVDDTIIQDMIETLKMALHTETLKISSSYDGFRQIQKEVQTAITLLLKILY